jgi:hypothetical protein
MMRKPGFPGDIAHYVMQMQVHLLQSLLHVLDLRTTGTDQVIPMPMQAPYAVHQILGSERGIQKPEAV